VIKTRHIRISSCCCPLRACVISGIPDFPFFSSPFRISASHNGLQSHPPAHEAADSTWLATPGHWIEVVCFTQPDIDGSYFSEREYRAIYRFAPSIQAAFETLDKALGEARDQI
jgi:hypothetical protein